MDRLPTIEDARARLPLGKLMEQYGHRPKKSMACPFCGHKTAGSYHETAGRHFFKCFHDVCPTGGKSLDEVGFIGQLRNENNPQAYILYMKEAGCWREVVEKPSLLSSGTRRRRPGLKRMLEGVSGVSPSDSPSFEGGRTYHPRASGAPSDEQCFSGHTSAGGPSDDGVPHNKSATTMEGGVTGLDSPTCEQAEQVRPETDVAGGPSPSVPKGGGGPDLEEDELLLPGDDVRDSGDRSKPVLPNQVHAALRAFYSALKWDPRDAIALFERRGLAPSTCRAAGLRSNRLDNFEILRGLYPKFPVEVLEQAGLWERASSHGDIDEDANPELDSRGRAVPIQGCVPSRFFYGYGVIGQEKAPDGTKRLKYGWNYPPIIPYFDLIPDDDEPGHASALVTEGEYKALAAWQAFVRDPKKVQPPPLDRLVGLRTHKKWGKGALPHLYMTPVEPKPLLGVAAVPGIGYVVKDGGTWQVAHMLEEWIARRGVERCWTIFDNEEKGDPSLPGFNPDIEQRFDSVVMALYHCKQLSSRGVRGYFSMLPDELSDGHAVYWDKCRDGSGKADWDGLLRAMITRFQRPAMERTI